MPGTDERRIEVSVVIPVGGVEYLDEQLEALMHQRDAPPYEIVLALNLDTPGVRAAVERLAAAAISSCAGEVPPIRIVLAAERRGASFARNRGAREAQAPVLAFCDSDDVVEDRWVAEITRALDEVDAVGGMLLDEPPDGGPLRRPPATPGTLPTLMGQPYIVSASFALTAELFEQLGGFDETLQRCEDIDISWRILRAGGRLGFAPLARATYRHRGSVWASVRQFYAYGRGVTQVLRLHPPDGSDRDEQTERPRRLRLVRPNTPIRRGLLLHAVLRRGALGAGRMSEMLAIAWRNRLGRGGGDTGSGS